MTNAGSHRIIYTQNIRKRIFIVRMSLPEYDDVPNGILEDEDVVVVEMLRTYILDCFPVSLGLSEAFNAPWPPRKGSLSGRGERDGDLLFSLGAR